MIYDHHRMKWLGVVLLGGVLAAGCTKPNPRSCLDGLCTDQAFPFCDVDGTLGGEPMECIAVECTPMQFESCRGDLALTCNTTGNDYDQIQCELGCDTASGGCRLCEPNQTTCTNGTVATCDSNGMIVASNPCPLGCFEDEPRCRDIDPSNSLAMYLDAVDDPPDLELTNGTFNTGTGEVSTGGGPVEIPNFLAPNGDGPSIRVFVVNSLRLEGVVSVFSQTDADRVSGPALAIVSRGDIVIDGRLSAGGRAGGVKMGSCLGGPGQYSEPQRGTARASGSGGGGHATSGARGGDISGLLLGGSAGTDTGTDHLVPLRGGCPSGGVVINGVTSLYGAPGGGAIQLVSGTRIQIDGIIDVRGEQGYSEQAGTAASVHGGGAGGGILLEAPQVSLGPDAKLIAKGGGGGAYGPTPPQDDTAGPAVGTSCGPTCTAGSGAAPGVAATAGTAVSNSSADIIATGGGGGGLGRVRINTSDAVYTKTGSTVEAAVVTAGLIQTR